MREHITKIPKLYNNNSGSTMVETLISFVVLVIVFAALFGMIRFSSNLRMRAIDTADVREKFNDEIYKSGNKNDVEIHEYFGAHSTIADNSDTMFYLKLNVDPGKTDASNLDPASGELTEELRVKFIKSIPVPNIDGTGMVSKDSRISEEKLAPPKVLKFEYNKEPLPSTP
ncbi:MAG: hypothetical protein J6M65_06080 [Eubacterium sp.]|nr:hypothetical protein [Eubacterium sp.]